MTYINMQESQADVVMGKTERNYFESCTKKQVQKASMYLKLQAMVGPPTQGRLKQMVSSKLLNDFPIKVEDVTGGHKKFRHDLVGF